MTTKTVANTNSQFARDLKAGRTALDKSHASLSWAILEAISSQDLSQLTTMRGMVAEAWPVLRSRFDDYILATLDNVKIVSGEFDDGGALFALKDSAVLATPWNSKDRLAKDAKPSKAIDPRVDIKRTINKCAKSTLVASLESKAAKQHVADILAKAMADIEAVAAGTYKAKAKSSKSTAKVVAITKAA